MLTRDECVHGKAEQKGDNLNLLLLTEDLILRDVGTYNWHTAKFRVTRSLHKRCAKKQHAPRSNMKFCCFLRPFPGHLVPIWSSA